MKYLVLDFECKDPYISRLNSPGWPYLLNLKDKSDMKILGCALKSSNKNTSNSFSPINTGVYLENKLYEDTMPTFIGQLISIIKDYPKSNEGNELLNKGSYLTKDFRLENTQVDCLSKTRHSALNSLQYYLSQYDILIAHNAQYDFGILKALGIDLKKKLLVDTMILSKLHYNALRSHSLDDLAKTYLKKRKNNKELCDAVWDNNLYPWLQKELKEQFKFEKNREIQLSCNPSLEESDLEHYQRTRPAEIKLEKWAKTNMDILQEKCPEIVAQYAIQDVVCTDELFNFFLTKNPDLKNKLEFYSDLIKCCLDMQAKGLRIDLNKAREIHTQLRPIKANLLKQCYDLAGKEFNLASPRQVTSLLKDRGLVIPKTAKGTDSATSSWLEEQDDELCKVLVKARKVQKIDNDFIQNIIDIQQWTLSISPSEVETRDFGVVYPSMNILGASATGRFSCAGPNLQQCPADEEYGPLCRSIFVPEPEETWYSLDFSNQEGRIQLDLANKLNCVGVKKLVDQFQSDPKTDMHQFIADMANIDRKAAKTINLGLAYGMGLKKLAKNLTNDEDSAKLILEKYFKLNPFLKDLMNKCANALKEKGFIYTITGRRIWDEPAVFIDGKRITFEHKALNKYAQGSAADQTMQAMVTAYKQGILPRLVIHDEINISSQNEEHAKQLAEVMQTCIESTIPHVAEIKSGKSWGEAKYTKEGSNVRKV